MLTSTTVCTPINLKSLCITVLFFGLCSDMVQFPSIMTDIIQFIFEHLRFHVVILSNIFFVSTCFPLFIILQLRAQLVAKLIVTARLMVNLFQNKFSHCNNHCLLSHLPKFPQMHVYAFLKPG